MTTANPHVEPIRPGGGLRRLRQGGDRRARPNVVRDVLPPDRFTSLLQTELERALLDEMTLVVMQVRVRPVPGSKPAGLDGAQLPPEMLDRIRTCHENVAMVLNGAIGVTLLVSSLRRRGDGDDLVATVLEALQPPITVDGLTYHPEPRVGAAMLDADNQSPELILEAARLALAECTAADPAMMFQPVQRIEHRRRRDNESELRAAVLDREIAVALQPAVDLETRELVAVEAFARWDRSDTGPVPASEFVQMASELGVGELITQQVLQKALTMLNILGAHDLTLWLNVSPDDLMHPDFPATVGDAVRSNPGIKVGVELSPSPPAVAHNVFRVLEQVADLGARVAIGDFGIGNSNLTVLRDLPFDSAKLARALIRRIADNETAAEMLRPLVELANLLGLETTGQGVEDEAQHAVLRDIGCRFGQGFHYAEPSTDCEALSVWFDQ